MIAHRTGLALLVLALAGAAAAQEPPRFRDDPGLVGPLRAGVRGLVLLLDGTVLEGRVVLDGRAAALRVDDPRPARRTAPAAIIPLDLAKVRGFVSLSAPGDDEDAPPPVRLVLADGSVVGGTLVERSADRIVLGGAGAVRTFTPAEVRSFHDARWVGLPLRTEQRHLEVPAAVLPSKGNLRVAIVEGAHLLATWAPTERLVLELGTALPVLQARSDPANVQGAVRAGLPVLPWLSVAVGAHLETSKAGRHAAQLSAGATASNGRLSASVFAGPAFAGANGLATLGDVAWAAAVSARVSRRMELVAEGWTSAPYGVGDGSLVSAALRYRWDRVALDAGLAVASDQGVVPWLGVAMDLLGR